MKLFNKLSKALLLIVGVLGTGAILTACGADNTAKSELIQPKMLTVGMTGDFPPYAYRSNGKMTGYEVQVAKAVAKEMHLKPKFKVNKWDGLVAGLGSRRFDVVLNDISQVHGAKAKHYISSAPYMYSRSVMVTRSSDNHIKTLHNIKGQKFAEGVGTGNWKIAKKYGAHVIPSPSELTSTMQMIKEGRIDGTVYSVDGWRGFAKAHSTKGLRAYAIPNSQYQSDPIAVLLAKSSPKLRNQINKALRKLRKNGTLKRLSEKYLKSNETINKSFGGVISNEK